MHESEAVGCLRHAAHALCAEGTVQVRLEAAYTHLARIAADALPDSLAARFEELTADLCYGGDTIADALSLMNPDDRVRLAERVVSLYGDACRCLHPED